MAMTLERKKAIVAEVAEVAGKAQSAVAAEYRGLTAPEMVELHKVARESRVYLRVVKNTLAKRAVEGTAFEPMGEALAGPLVLAFSLEGPGDAARVIKSFSKEHEKLKPHLVAVEGKVLPPSEIERLASLPTREEAIAQLMAVMKAPIEKLVRTLAEPHSRLVRLLAAIRDQKQA
ncbi:MAG: 50S ribosomal protein L10 [Gammaproteobacteria bacterium]|nr:MAG: 50S ribosomal protein L10 [Gammaproteobacteria bacterium]